MNTEQRVLKQIADRGGGALIRLIAGDLKMNNDHVRYLCKELLKKGLLRELEKKDWYEITPKGWKRIGKEPTEELSQKHENTQTQKYESTERQKQKLPARLPAQRHQPGGKQEKSEDKKFKNPVKFFKKLFQRRKK